jgi:hypothetical protein
MEDVPGDPAALAHDFIHNLMSYWQLETFPCPYRLVATQWKACQSFLFVFDNTDIGAA